MAECYAVVSRDYLRSLIIALLFAFMAILYASYANDEMLLKWSFLYGMFLPTLVVACLLIDLFLSAARGCPVTVSMPEEPESRVILGFAFGAVALFLPTIAMFRIISALRVTFSALPGAEGLVLTLMMQWAIAHLENGVVYFVPDVMAGLSGAPRFKLPFVLLTAAFIAVLHQWAYGSLALTATSLVFFAGTGLMYHGYVPYAPPREAEGYALAHFVWNSLILTGLHTFFPAVIAVSAVVVVFFLIKGAGRVLR